MIEPHDYGLSTEETLARVGDPTRAREHKIFWAQWWDAVTAARPTLSTRRELDPSDPTATHEFESLRHVRIGCRLHRPDQPLRAMVVVTHGYQNVPPLDEQAQQLADFATDGLGVLLVRVRGFAGSRLDTPQLPPAGQTDSQWVIQGLSAPGEGPNAIEPWVVPQAVADVVNACRAARNLLIDESGANANVFLMGESLGATLAVVATALLHGKLPHDPVVKRLVFGLPTLCDWPWRQTQPPPTTGTGAQVQRVLANAPQHERTVILNRLRVMDPVVHAPQIRCPVLCKLAERDDVAPAPAAAAVYNALGCDPGRKWRFLVPFGHFDAGIANARRHALFQKCARDFLTPTSQPRNSMARWTALLSSGQHGPEDTTHTEGP